MLYFQYVSLRAACHLRLVLLVFIPLPLPLTLLRFEVREDAECLNDAGDDD